VSHRSRSPAVLIFPRASAPRFHLRSVFDSHIIEHCQISFSVWLCRPREQDSFCRRKASVFPWFARRLLLAIHLPVWRSFPVQIGSPQVQIAVACKPERAVVVRCHSSFDAGVHSLICRSIMDLLHFSELMCSIKYISVTEKSCWCHFVWRVLLVSILHAPIYVSAHISKVNNLSISTWS
jgi:hypothetical protein